MPREQIPMEARVTKDRLVPQKTSVQQVVLPTVTPLFVAIFAASVTLIIGDRYGLNALPFVLVPRCMVLIGSAPWLNRVVFNSVISFLPFVQAAGLIPRQRTL